MLDLNADTELFVMGNNSDHSIKVNEEFTLQPGETRVYVWNIAEYPSEEELTAVTAEGFFAYWTSVRSFWLPKYFGLVQFSGDKLE